MTNVTVVQEASCAGILSYLRRQPEVACDIEITGDQELLCVGFASSSSEAFVFRAGSVTPAVIDLIEAERPRKIFANGMFDSYFLKTRCGINVGGYRDDTQLAWHACYPELAGKSEFKKASASRKSLKFLVSMFLDDEWYKDYDVDEEGMYRLNGLDCMLTYDIMVNHLRPLVAKMGVEETYRLELALVPLCLEMQERGIRVDDGLRKERFEALDGRVGELQERVKEAVRGDVEAAIEAGKVKREHLFRDVWTCPCCRNGKGKREHCTSCAGVEGTGKNGAIVKGDLGKWAAHSVLAVGKPQRTKEDLIDLLPPCTVCSGEGQRTTFAFNGNSDEQKSILLYEVWRLPPKYHEKKLSVREDKLKALMAGARTKGQTERAAIITDLLWISRCGKMRGEYSSIAPGEDGRIRSVLNPSGTETGRLSHGTTFLEPSRNLANMAKKRAGLDPLFAIRECFIPSEGFAFVSADLSQVEARLTAYTADEPRAMREYAEGIDRYRAFVARLHEVGYEEVTAEQRYLGKTLILALERGVGPKTLTRTINADEELTGISVTEKEGKVAYELFYDLYPGYRRWHAALLREMEKNGGWLRTQFGRRRDFFGRTDSQSAREALLREIVSHMVQSPAVDLLNRAMLRVREEVKELRLLLQVHDEILGEVEVGREREVARRVVEVMTFPVRVGRHEIVVPVEAAVSRENWGEMEKV